MDNLKYELEEEEEVTLGLQRLQRRDTVKIGHILRMMNKINLK